MIHRTASACRVARLTSNATLLALTLLTLSVTATGAQGHAGDSLRLDEAIRQQVELIEANPSDEGLMVDLGNLLVLAGRGEEAEAVYRRVLASDPAAVDAAYNLALLLQENGRLDEAIELHEMVILVAPQTAWSHYQIGRIYESRGQKSPALDAYVRAFSLDPELGFPDVNPHVLENALATKALLLSNPTVLDGQSAPRSYTDGYRISLLLAAEDSSPDGDDASEAESESSDSGGDESLSSESLDTQGLTSSGAAPIKTTYSAREDDVSEDEVSPTAESEEIEPVDPVEETEPSASTTRLGPDDLRDLGRANRADPPVESGGVAPRNTTRSRAGAVRTAPPPRPRPRTGTDTGSSRPPAGATTPPPPATGSRFRPGRRSSAQLDLELLPSQPRPDSGVGSGVVAGTAP